MEFIKGTGNYISEDGRFEIKYKSEYLAGHMHYIVYDNNSSDREINRKFARSKEQAMKMCEDIEQGTLKLIDDDPLKPSDTLVRFLETKRISRRLYGCLVRNHVLNNLNDKDRQPLTLEMVCEVPLKKIAMQRNLGEKTKAELLALVDDFGLKFATEEEYKERLEKRNESAKKQYDFLRKGANEAFKNNGSFGILPEIYIWRLKGNIYGVARAEGTYPLSIYHSVPEVILGALIRFEADCKIAEKLGIATENYYNRNRMVILELGEDCETTLDELIREAERAVDNQINFSAL